MGYGMLSQKLIDRGSLQNALPPYSPLTSLYSPRYFYYLWLSIHNVICILTKIIQDKKDI